jgi:hypothetical protein
MPTLPESPEGLRPGQLGVVVLGRVHPLVRFAHAWMAAFGAHPGWLPAAARREEWDNKIEIRSTETAATAAMIAFGL